MNADDLPFEAFRVAKDAAHKCMVDLDMAAHKPIQGEAMHKVMGWQVLEALYDAGWIMPPDSEAAAKTRAWDALYEILGVRVDHFYQSGDGRAMMSEKQRRVEMNAILATLSGPTQDDKCDE